MEDKTFYIASADLLPLQKRLLRSNVLLDKTGLTGSLNLKNLTEAPKQELGGFPHGVDDDEFKTVFIRLKDSMVATKCAQVCSDSHSIIKPRSFSLVAHA